MPVSPIEVWKLIEDTPLFGIEKAFNAIDEKLLSVDWLRANMTGNKEVSRAWEITVKGTLSELEMRQLTEGYLRVGWDQVIVVNTEDNDEKPGLWVIRLVI